MTSSFTRWSTATLAAAVLLSTPALAATKLAASTEAQTRHPIVLVHGLFGFDDILGLDYWYKIPDDLRKNGATVLVAKVSALNDNDVRGEQLLQQLRQWQATKSYRKFNLIGHSQGGPTARYVAGVAPDLIASVTTVGSPHVLPETGRDDLVGKLLTQYASVATFLGKSIDFLSGSAGLPADPAALKAWSENTAAFNARFPAGAPTSPCGQGPELAANGVRYYSATGNVDQDQWLGHCRPADDRDRPTQRRPGAGVLSQVGAGAARRLRLEPLRRDQPGLWHAGQGRPQPGRVLPSAGRAPEGQRPLTTRPPVNPGGGDTELSTGWAIIQPVFCFFDSAPNAIRIRS